MTRSLEGSQDSALRHGQRVAPHKDRGVLDQPLDVGDSADLFVNEFNRHRDSPRMLALVSPTCQECLAGARSARAAVTESSGRSVLLIVWMKGLPDDDRIWAENKARELRGDRIHQFWDGQDLVGAHVADRLGRAGLVAWDIYLGFRSGFVWEEEMPESSGWVHQMGDAGWADDRERAVASELNAKMRGVLSAMETPPP
jgi:hypothetical protein